MNSPRREYETFLFLHGAQIVQAMLLVSILVNGWVAIYQFGSGNVLYGVWALCATLLLPRAILALFLIHERTGMLYSNLTPLLNRLYGGTVARHLPLAIRPLERWTKPGKDYSIEALYLLLWLGPLLFMVLR